MATSPSPGHRWPRWLRWALAVEALGPSVLFFAAEPEGPSLLVPLAGPWAARLYGHSCGMDSFSPVGTWGLFAFGLVSLVLAHRAERPLAVLPAALLWWPAWLVAGVVSAINAHM